MDNIFGEFHLRRAAVDGIEEAVAWHTVGLIADDGTTIGTASAVLWRGRAFFLTARHVVENSCDRQMWFFPRPRGTLEYHEAGDIVDAVRVPKIHRIQIPLRRVYLCEFSDLAALEVEQEQDSLGGVRFFDDLSRSQCPDVAAVVFFQGYPAALGRVVAPGELAAFRRVEIREVQSSVEAPEHNSLDSFLLDYREDTDGIDPHGFSGAGVWFRTGGAILWHPNLQLGGVITSFFRSRGLLEALRVDVVRRFLDEVAT